MAYNYCLFQAFAFIFKYARLKGDSQEAYYNLGRAFHHIGMVLCIHMCMYVCVCMYVSVCMFVCPFVYDCTCMDTGHIPCR